MSWIGPVFGLSRGGSGPASRLLGEHEHKRAVQDFWTLVVEQEDGDESNDAW